MDETETVTCKICSKELVENEKFCSRNNNSILIKKEDLSIDENLLACDKCKIETEEAYQLCMQKENAALPQSLVNHFLKQEIVQIKDELIENEGDDILFNSNVPIIIKEAAFYYCSQCNYSTNNKGNLTDHIFSHCFECKECSYITFDNFSMRTHNELHSNVKGLYCKVVNRTGADTVNCDGVSLMSFECHDCGYQTSSKTALKSHVTIHKGARGYKCNPAQLCSKVQHEEFQMKGFMKEKRFKSNYSSNGSSELKAHSYKHRGNWLFSCDKCDFKTHFESNLTWHKSVHTTEKQYKCNLCGYSCNNVSNLRIHFYKHSGDWPFSCDKCDYKTHCNSHLSKHKRVHTSEKPYTCDLCNYRCKNVSTLKQHSYRHSGYWPFSCDKCDYKTHSKTLLTKHKLIHTSEKPFKCNLCDYRCNYSSNLKQHSYKHSDDLCFSCDKCDYKTHSKPSFTNHKLIHIEEKSFKCNLCDYRCNRSRNLKIHSYKHSGNWPFSCDKCDYKTNDKSNLIRHVKVHTNK